MYNERPGQCDMYPETVALEGSHSQKHNIQCVIDSMSHTYNSNNSSNRQRVSTPTDAMNAAS